MPEKQDYYETLGLKKGATNEEIRKAYKRLARKYHPDLNPGDQAAEERFKQIQEANSVLTDPKKRQLYDQFGFYSPHAQPGAGPQPGGPGAGFGFDFSGFDFSDLGGGARQSGGSPFTGAGGGFSDIFGQFFGGGHGRRQPHPKPEPGADLEYALNIDFWQAIRGTQIRLRVNRQSACTQCHGTGSSGGASASCPECSGSGSVTQTAGAMRFKITCPRCGGTGQLRNVCPACRGEGRTVTAETVDVRIPPGANSGSRLRVAGKGNAGTMGAPAGDLYITVRVAEHPYFHRNGNDIQIELPIQVWEAALGTKIEVPTIDGKALLKIPRGTQNGQKFRLREKGVTDSRKGTRGDQIVQVAIQTPPASDERTREILRELGALHQEDPRSEIWNKVKS